MLGWLGAQQVANDLGAAAFTTGTSLPAGFYPVSAAAAQPPVIAAAAAAMPSLVASSVATPPGGARPAAQTGAMGAALGDAVAQASRFTSGELLVRTIGAVAVVAATGGLAVGAASKVVDAFRDQPQLERAVGTSGSDGAGSVGAIVGDDDTTPPDRPLTEQLAAIDQRLKDIKGKLDEQGNRPPPPDLRRELGDLRRAVDDVRLAVTRVRIPPQPAQIDPRPGLSQIDSRLQETNGRIDTLSNRISTLARQSDPRRTVSGR